ETVDGVDQHARGVVLADAGLRRRQRDARDVQPLAFRIDGLRERGDLLNEPLQVEGAVVKEAETAVSQFACTYPAYRARLQVTADALEQTGGQLAAHARPQLLEAGDVQKCDGVGLRVIAGFGDEPREGVLVRQPARS